MGNKSDHNKFKILLINLGYCTGINGKILHYFLYFYRYIYRSLRTENRVLNELKKIIRKENPNLICLIEINQGRQIKELINNKYFFYKINTKYGSNSVLKRCPLFRKKSNAFIAKQKLPFKIHFLKNGTKKLLYEITLPNEVTLLLMHFSLNKQVRDKQFKEIYKMFSERDKLIICGDFNIFDGFNELNYIMDKFNLKLVHKSPTFPAFKPNKSLDIFLCTKNIKTTYKVLSNQLSDHLPVIMETTL
jgi:exonuclease III